MRDFTKKVEKYSENSKKNRQFKKKDVQNWLIFGRAKIDDILTFFREFGDYFFENIEFFTIFGDFFGFFLFFFYEF